MYILLVRQGAPNFGGGGRCGVAATPKAPKTEIKKNIDFVDMWHRKFYAIFPSAENSHWISADESALEFWKIN